MDMDSKLKQWLLQTDLLFLSTLITGVVILGGGGGGGGGGEGGVTSK